MADESNLHIPSGLPDFGLKVESDQEDFKVARALFPPKNVKFMTGKYFITDFADSFRTAHDVRANRSRANQINQLDKSTTSYTLVEHSLGDVISQRDRDEAADDSDPEFDSARDIMMLLLRNKEVNAAEKAFTSTSFGGGNTLILSNTGGAAPWDSDTATSNPIDDYKTAKQDIGQNIGKVPIGTCMGRATFDVLEGHQAILDRFKYSDVGIIDESKLGKVFGLRELVVSDVITRTTAPGISQTTAYLFNNAAVVYYNEQNPGRRTANFGITFQKNEMDFESWDEPWARGTGHDYSWFYTQNFGSTLSGFYIGNAHS
jgi:hypothetical protein